MATSSSPRTGPAAGDLTGRVLAGRYRLTRAIASGGMATVWEGTDQLLARKVAVKILHPHLARDDAFVRRFRGEAIAAARLTHPSIVSVYDTVTDDGIEAIVMELVSGTTLRADIDHHGPLRLAAVLAIGTQVADALGAAHASGLVHRDVKPANILLSADGRVLVADFGIAKAAEGADLTNDGAMVGTAKYLAPEQVEGAPVDGRTDLYALGIVLYEALTGSVPFKGETDTATALARLHHDPPPPRQLRPDIPPAVEAVVGRALARRPADRFPDAAAMRAALMGVGADPGAAGAVAQAAVAAAAPGTAPVPVPPAPPTSAPALALTDAGAAVPAVAGGPPSVPGPAPRPPAGRRRRAWIPTLALLVALAAIAAVVGLYASQREERASGSPVAIASFTTFDPLGDRTEKDDLLANLADDDPATVWRTENYGSGLKATKDGVGLVVHLRSPATNLRSLTIETPEAGWTASIHTVDGDVPADLAGWGDAVAVIDPARAGPNTANLHDRPGRAVLIWFTRTTAAHNARVGRVTVRAA